MTWLIPTAECSRCHNHFAAKFGLLRDHADGNGTQCQGSGRPPFWAREAEVA